MEETREIAVQEPAKTYPSIAAVDQVQTTHDPFQGRRQIAAKLVQAIYLVFGAIDALLAIGFGLRVLGANASASFAELIYGPTAWLASPFAGLFSARSVEGGGVLEVNMLVALVVYALLAWLLGWMARLLVGETRTGRVAYGRYVRTNVH